MTCCLSAQFSGTVLLQDFPQLNLRFLSACTQDHQIVTQDEIRDGRVRRISHVLSVRKSIIPFSLRKRIIQQTDNIDFYPFLHCSLPMTVWAKVPRWEIVMCVFMCVPFSKSTGLLFVFKVVHLLPDLSRCPFFFSPSFLLPVRQHMSHSITGFISSSLSSSPLPLFPFLPMQSELAAYDAGRILISSNLHPNNGWSREPIHLFFSPRPYPPWTPDSSLSSSLSISVSPPTAHITLLCFSAGGCLWKRVKYREPPQPQTVNLTEGFSPSTVTLGAEPPW